jgi:hypothetical protein
LIALGAGARQRQLGIGGVQPRHELTSGDAVALVRGQLEQASADQRGHLHLCGFDLPRNADTIGGLGIAAGTSRGDQNAYTCPTQGD